MTYSNNKQQEQHQQQNGMKYNTNITSSITNKHIYDDDTMQLITYTFRLYSIYTYTDYAYAEKKQKKQENT